MGKIKEIKAIVDVLLSEFITKPLDENLSLIAKSWEKYYPEIFIERSWFEDAMGYYRYTPKDGWSHTAYIADNFKAIDFYKKTGEVGNNIFAETVVSMKTTTTKNVEDWLKTNSIKNNISNLQNSIGGGLNKGITWNGKNIQYNRAEVHIYMRKENITLELESSWLNKLKKEYPNISFEINALENFVK
ncbi:hypothetical protein [Sphingobacterium sp. xlx-130]|uniref:hypothetical protein n=1 Tax=Sphingobacterium sp. xlx-130 TaxID=2654323 RepID=UPI0013DA77E4|nr:hypothetical protein [Sphingobacterium sp. xlx-130]